MVCHIDIAAEAFMLAGICLHAEIDLPGIFLVGFELPAGFCHQAAAADIGFADGSAEAGCGNRAVAFPVELIIPGQTVVVIVPARPVVHARTDAQQAAVHPIQLVVCFSSAEQIAADMRVKILAVHIEITRGALRAAQARAFHLVRQIKDVSKAHMAAPVIAAGVVAIGTAVAAVKDGIRIVLQVAEVQGTFHIVLVPGHVFCHQAAAIVVRVAAARIAGTIHTVVAPAVFIE